MAKMVMALCGRLENGGGEENVWKIRRLAFVPTSENEGRVRDLRFLNGVIQRISTTRDGRSLWEENVEPDEGDVRFFDIIIEVENHGKETARYGIDYHRHNGCPQRIVEDGMAMYEIIRREAIRPLTVAARAALKSAK